MTCWAGSGLNPDYDPIFSMHISGEQLEQLTGLCAILRSETKSDTRKKEVSSFSLEFTVSVRLDSLLPYVFGELPKSSSFVEAVEYWYHLPGANQEFVCISYRV
jgi:hypothetical protein